MWSVLVNISCEFEKHVYCTVVGLVICTSPLYQLMVVLNSTVPLLRFFFFSSSCLSISDRGVLKSASLIVNSNTVFLSVLPRVLWCTIIGSIYIKDCCVFLENWPLYPYVMRLYSWSFFLAVKCPVSKINRSILIFFSFLLAWCIFIHPFTCNLYVSYI